MIDYTAAKFDLGESPIPRWYADMTNDQRHAAWEAAETSQRLVDLMFYHNDGRRVMHDQRIAATPDVNMRHLDECAVVVRHPDAMECLATRGTYRIERITIWDKNEGKTGYAYVAPSPDPVFKTFRDHEHQAAFERETAVYLRAVVPNPFKGI